MSILKVGLIILMLLHGIIHILGFVKAFDFFEISQLTQEVSKPMGWLWLLVSLLFIAATINFGLEKEWSTYAILGVIISQILIVNSWSDAKYGTVINVLVFIIAMMPIMGNQFKKSFLQDASSSIMRASKTKHETLVNKDILHLPISVQKYLHFADVVGKPKLRSMKVIINGKMRGKNRKWFNFNSLQYNTFDINERMFFMDAEVNKLPTRGYHRFKKDQVKMDIRILSMFPAVSKSGDLLKKAETVTLFNDMCIMAPASLIDKNIKWIEVNENQAIAYFTNDDITISAKLFFDNDGALMNFYSDDRIDINDNKAYGFSTPISGFKEQNGYMMPTYGEAIWHYPDGDFVYGKFNIESIKYNVKRVQE